MIALLNHVAGIMEQGEPDAWACIQGDRRHSALKGIVLFYPLGKGSLVIVVVEGLPIEGFYGFHIHEGSKCSGNEQDMFADAGTHFNPAARKHPNHAGDLPPLLSDEGMAYLSFVTGRFSPKQIIGRTIVIHDMADDFTSQPAGNAGNKIGCGVISKRREW